MIFVLSSFVLSTIVAIWTLRKIKDADPKTASLKISARSMALIGGMLLFGGIATIVFTLPASITDGSVLCMFPRRSCHVVILRSMDPSKYWIHVSILAAIPPICILFGLRILRFSRRMREVQP